jgi:predicted transcriptional regulator
MTIEKTTDAREQAINKLREYRREYTEADSISQAIDARMWENWGERVSETAREVGLTGKEIEDILYGDG